MIRYATIIISLILISFTVRAEQSRVFGDYTVHYSAFNTSILSPEVARSYNISRSKNRAMVNLSVLKKVMGTSVQPVRARISGTATNLSSQLRELDMREISDHGAIYYIAQVSINDGETLRFNFSIQPEGEEKPFSLEFEQQFFAD